MLWQKVKPAATKVLDTSCIIDGRIEDLLGTGFWKVNLVPHFVLQELQQVADASKIACGDGEDWKFSIDQGSLPRSHPHQPN